MKTSKQYRTRAGKYAISFVFTLHELGICLSWAAPASEGKRLISFSLHLPFFVGTVSFWGKDGI